MEVSETAGGGNEPPVLDRWTARKVQPVVLLYVVLVFAGFMALSLFVFHSREAVTALAMAAVAAVFATLPGVFERIEYRATEAGLEKRVLRTRKPGEFTGVFRWDELDRVVPMKHGFKFFKPLPESNPIGRFWKLHVCDTYSGEVHVETADVERVLDLVARWRSTVEGHR